MFSYFQGNFLILLFASKLFCQKHSQSTSFIYKTNGKVNNVQRNFNGILFVSSKNCVYSGKKYYFLSLCSV